MGTNMDLGTQTSTSTGWSVCTNPIASEDSLNVESDDSDHEQQLVSWKTMTQVHVMSCEGHAGLFRLGQRCWTIHCSVGTLQSPGGCSHCMPGVRDQSHSIPWQGWQCWAWWWTYVPRYPVTTTRLYYEEGVSGNTKGETTVDHHREAVTVKDGAEPEKEKLLTKLKHKLVDDGQKHKVTDSNSDIQGVDSDGVLQGDEEEKPGFVTTLKHKLVDDGQKHKVTDSNSDIQGVDSDAVLQGDEEEKPGFVTTLKHKLHTNHDKHHNEINLEIFE